MSCLEQSVIIRQLLTDRSVPSKEDHLSGVHPNSEAVSELYDEVISIRKVLKNFSEGDFNMQITKRGIVWGYLKTLQANLQHLAWQVEQVANGDLSQRVDFMGDFSIAFNKMVLQLEEQKKELIHYSLNLEKEVEKKTKTVSELQDAILTTIAGLIECRDTVTGGHIERTQQYLTLLVGLLLEEGVYVDELSSWNINKLAMSSQLHDVGKVAIKDSILIKSGKLTDEEFEAMKKHTVIGAEVIRKIESATTDNEFLHYAEVFAESHHEKWNGEGYPYGLKGHEIPLQGRLMAIVDVYDALTNERPYKKAFTHEKSVEIIRKESGEHFDPRICDVFLKHENVFRKAMSGEESTIISTESALKSGLQSAQSLASTISAISNVICVRSRCRTDNIKRHLKILLNALLSHDDYKDEVSGWDLDLFFISADLYDVGKIAVNSRILDKTEKLTEDEYEAVKAHTKFGSKIIKQIKDKVSDGDMLSHAEALVSSHHEKWDGTGYPLGLKGKEIPLQARMMSIVDVYGALVSDRPYRERKTHEDAIEIIRHCSGTYFDPDLVKVFLKCEQQLRQVEEES